MKKTLIAICLLNLAINSVVLGIRPELKFNSSKQFKIIQFTDIHFKMDSYRSDSTLVLMKNLVTSEKPDLVILTGDIISSNDTRNAWIKVLNTLSTLKVPWAIVLGNHDIEAELSGIQIMKTISKIPYSVTANGPEKIAGNGNYVLKIHSSESSKTAALLYFMDSHSGFKTKTDLGGYEWIDFSQVKWYREESEKFTRKNKGNPYPALAFFHIPLPEYKEVIGKSTTVGSQSEGVSSPDLNSGMYTAMLEKKDVMGMFVGHDHNNNFIGCLRGICLAYGNSTGRQSYGIIGKGARVIVLHEGARKFDSWVVKMYECNRDKDIWTPATDRDPKYYVTYPDSFQEKK